MNNQEVIQPKLDLLLAQLETLINDMEHGDLNLEDSLTSFANGITLVKKCQHLLNEAEQKIAILSDDCELEAFDN